MENTHITETQCSTDKSVHLFVWVAALLPSILSTGDEAGHIEMIVADKVFSMPVTNCWINWRFLKMTTGTEMCKHILDFANFVFLFWKRSNVNYQFCMVKITKSPILHGQNYPSPIIFEWNHHHHFILEFYRITITPIFFCPNHHQFLASITHHQKGSKPPPPHLFFQFLPSALIIIIELSFTSFNTKILSWTGEQLTVVLQNGGLGRSTGLAQIVVVFNYRTPSFITNKSKCSISTTNLPTEFFTIYTFWLKNVHLTPQKCATSTKILGNY